VSKLLGAGLKLASWGTKASGLGKTIVKSKSKEGEDKDRERAKDWIEGEWKRKSEVEKPTRVQPI
jgi:hypothetical protein